MALGRQRARKEVPFMRGPVCLRAAIRALSILGEICMRFVLRALPLTFDLSRFTSCGSPSACVCYIFIYPRFAERRAPATHGPGWRGSGQNENCCIRRGVRSKITFDA